MKQKDINKLLERFLDGETTLQEERRLYAYFSQDDVPEELKAYQEMFRAYAAVASKTERKPVVVRPLWRRVAILAAAACLITAVLISYTLYINTESKEQKKEDVQLAETIQVEPTPAPSPSDLPPSKEVIAEESTHSPEPAKVKKTSPKPSLPKEKESAPQTEKSLPAPSHMDDFREEHGYNKDLNNTWAAYTNFQLIKPTNDYTMAIWRTYETTYLAISGEMKWEGRYWDFPSGTVLVDETGKQYKLREVQGIIMDHHFWANESPGDFIAFVLEFEPIPLNVTTLSYIEPPSEPFKVWGARWNGMAISNLNVEELRANQSLFTTYHERVTVK